MFKQYNVEKFSGKGFKDPMVVHESGGIETAVGVSVFASSVKRILTTAFGERVMMPTFGSNLWRMLFKPLDNQLQKAMEIVVLDAIRRWEKRIELLSFNIVKTEEEGYYNMVIDYKIKGTGKVERFLYPFSIDKFIV